jgi:uncharacterized membrane protein
MQSVSESFSGPLPSPQLLERYDVIVPGAAERIIVMAEKQLEHRQDLERMVVASNTQSQTQGLWLGFILAMVVVVSGAFLIYHGHDVYGLAAIISALAALVGVFVYGKYRQKKDLKEKAIS